MNELDERGWAHIHHAASHGFDKSIERFVAADPAQLELPTGDDLNSTPFLLAVTSGNKDSVRCLLELGAKINAINTENQGAVEICALKHYVELLEYFIEYGSDKLPVWKNLLKLVTSDTEEEVLAVGKCLRTMTQGSEAPGINPNWRNLYSNGGVSTIVKVIKGFSISEEAKIPLYQTLLNVISEMTIKEQIVGCGGIPVLIKQLKSEHPFAVQLSAQILKELSKVKEYADLAAQSSAIPALLAVVKTNKVEEVLVEAVEALGNIAAADESHQITIGSTNGAVESLVSLFEDCVCKPLLMALTKIVKQLAANVQQNQNALVNARASHYVLLQTKGRHKDLQICAVEAIYSLAKDNPYTQKCILEERAEVLLMQMLTKSRAEQLLEWTAGALWALAGESFDTKKAMAEGIGVPQLIEFMNSVPERLHYIGSEGLGVLAQGPRNLQSKIGESNGILPMVRHLKSDKEYIVLSVIQTLRYLCVGVAYIPNTKNQGAISHARGIRFLVALMVHSRNEMIQVEAALALASVALGNEALLAEIQKNIDFSYVRILKMMYSSVEMVRLLAGAALAMFAYNNLGQQREIADQGGVRYNCLVPFLQSDDEFFRCNAAFQVVVLARIIPDKEQATSSAIGIKLLTNLLAESQSDTILALTADCIARLSHTRAGVPNAIIAVDTVESLCGLLNSHNDQVRGCAAIALGYLSHNHIGERQLLRRCRCSPYLMKVLQQYIKRDTTRIRLSASFEEGWQHYKKVGLPPIEEGRISLVASDSTLFKDGGLRPDTTASNDDTEKSSNNPSSASNLHLVEDGSLTGRSSRTTNGMSVLSLQNSNPSDSQGSRLSVNALSQDNQLPQAIAAEFAT